MKLDKIYDLQLKLQDELGTIYKIRKSPALRQEYINQMLLAIHEEAVEIMRETAYKNPDYVTFGWKKNQGFNRENCADELIDLLHFFFNLCIAIEMDPGEIYSRFVKKHEINRKRKQDGY